MVLIRSGKLRNFRSSIRWPDLVKIGVPTLFAYGIMGAFPAIFLFTYFILVLTTAFCKSRGIPERTTTDHVLVAMLVLFALHRQVLSQVSLMKICGGKNGAPPAIRIGAAVMMLTMAIEAGDDAGCDYIFFAVVTTGEVLVFHGD